MMSVEAARPRKVRSSLSTSSSSVTSPWASLPCGHAPDGELAEVGGDAGDALDGLEDGVDRAVADGGVLDDLAVGAADADGGRRQHARCRPSCAG